MLIGCFLNLTFRAIARAIDVHDLSIGRADVKKSSLNSLVFKPKLKVQRRLDQTTS